VRPQPNDIDGNLILVGNDAFQKTTHIDCHGAGGYDDIAAGTQVTIKDQAGAIIATGALDGGTWFSGTKESCGFHFVVSKVPDATFYSIEVSHRGALT
jgi:hypothetical protein